MKIRRTRPRSRAVPSHRRAFGLRARDLRVRTKLLLVLTVPLLGFLGVTGVQVATSVRISAELDSFSSQVALGREIDTLVHELQRERDGTFGALAAGERVRDLSALAPDRTAVDRATAALEAAAQPLTGDATFARAYQTADAGLSELDAIRDGAQSGWLRAPATFDAYSRIIADLHDLLLVPSVVGGDANVGRAVRAFASASRAKEVMAQIRGVLYGVCTAGRFGPGELDAISDLRARQKAAIAQFRDEADAATVTAWDEAVSGQAGRTVSRLEQTLVDNVRADDLGVDPQQWWQASTTQLERVRAAEEQFLGAAIATAEARSAQERRSTQAGALLSVLLMIIALLTSFAIARIMVRPSVAPGAGAGRGAPTLPAMIERLRTEPMSASATLVEPIAIRSADEVGEVAEAFTAVHRSAVRLAAEQAMMRHSLNAIHVNLARRSQTLVERQLQLLDHLKRRRWTRISSPACSASTTWRPACARNDENLLVLAGGHTERRWNEPVPLATVVLAAAAEIEHYPRVRHDITDNVHIVGHAVADLVHLVAELLENATVFSSPDTPVTGSRDGAHGRGSGR